MAGREINALMPQACILLHGLQEATLATEKNAFSFFLIVKYFAHTFKYLENPHTHKMSNNQSCFFLQLLRSSLNHYNTSFSTHRSPLTAKKNSASLQPPLGLDPCYILITQSLQRVQHAPLIPVGITVITSTS